MAASAGVPAVKFQEPDHRHETEIGGPIPALSKIVPEFPEVSIDQFLSTSSTIALSGRICR